MKKLVAYITTGFPNKEFSVDLALSMREAGVDILELGIPFSDPVADGPVIEKANLKALENGFRSEDLFYVTSKISSSIETYWMGYFNPFYKKGVDFFINKGVEAGAKGFIIPDLPFEEGLKYADKIKEANLNLIDFIAPTDPRERIQKITANSRGFIYLVAYAGITGAAKSEDLTEIITCIKESSKTPVFIGFGVNEKTAKEKAQNVDGVVVGSALVSHLLDESLTNKEKITKIATVCKNIKEAINS